MPYDHDAMTVRCEEQESLLVDSLKELPETVQIHIRGTVMSDEPIAVGRWQEKHYRDESGKGEYCGCLVTNGYHRSATAQTLHGDYADTDIADTLSQFYGVTLSKDVMGEVAEAFDEWVSASRCLELGRYLKTGQRGLAERVRVLTTDSPIRATLRDLFTTNDIGLPKEGN